MTKLNNEIRELNINELTIEEMDNVTGGDSAILALVKEVGLEAALHGITISTGPLR
jgi:bacteriocin-like protein